MHFWFDSTTGDVRISQSICQPGYDGGDRDRNVLTLQSSGTAGLPKPIYTSHKYLLSFVTCHAFSFEESAQGLNISPLPLYRVRSVEYAVLWRMKLMVIIDRTMFSTHQPCLLGVGKTLNTRILRKSNGRLRRSITRLSTC